MSLQNSGSGKDGIAAFAHAEDPIELVTQPEPLQELAGSGVIEKVVATNAPVNLAGAVANADHHLARAAAPRVGLLRIEPRNKLLVKVRRFVAAHTFGFQAFLLLLSFPLGRRLLFTEPSVGMGYARKYLRKPAAYPAALGGYTIDGPYSRRRSTLTARLDRFFHWLGA